jgi:hypothetical protein
MGGFIGLAAGTACSIGTALTGTILRRFGLGNGYHV